jgi:cytoplasmic iron level regulating protein YaaA (DUF328/UPF0246 family)
MLVNLTSDKYFTSVKPAKLYGSVSKPMFLDEKNVKYKWISFYTKKGLWPDELLYH